MSTLLAFLHHLAAFALVAALAVEFVLVRRAADLRTMRRILIADAVFGASAAAVLVVGLLRVFYFDKGPEYYWTSHAFLTKLGVFILIGLLSIVPTMEFLSWRKAIKAGRDPAVKPEKIRTIRTIMHAELAGIVIILLMAAMMARGGWV
jgi:putative membrane protein